MELSSSLGKPAKIAPDSNQNQKLKAKADQGLRIKYLHEEAKKI
jgi:hypothetical protein